ncbi:hypothetical protein ACHAXS_000057, partial [Conticribra weissflogii]
TNALTLPCPSQGRRADDASLLSKLLPDRTSVNPALLSHFSLLLSQFILFVGISAIIPTLPLYGRSLGLSSIANGVVIAAPALSLHLFSHLSGERADRTQKPAMMAGMALVALFDVLTSLLSALPSLLVVRLGLGLGRGLAKAGERGMLADLAGRAPAPRGWALALQRAAVGLGVAIGAPVGGEVVEEFGPRSALLCVSATAVAALGMYALLPETAAAAALSSPRKDAGDNWRAIGMEAQEADDCGVKPTG